MILKKDDEVCCRGMVVDNGLQRRAMIDAGRIVEILGNTAVVDCLAEFSAMHGMPPGPRELPVEHLIAWEYAETAKARD